MGCGPTKENHNKYFKARKSAAFYNEKLYSREGASELLGVSVSTLADYELGNTKVVPVDKVLLMSDLYNAPDLKSVYCKNECPIGKNYSIATEINPLEGIALRLLREFDANSLEDIKSKLIDIAADGKIDDDEKLEFKGILDDLDQMAYVISEVKLIGEKVLNKVGE